MILIGKQQLQKGYLDLRSLQEQEGTYFGSNIVARSGVNCDSHLQVQEGALSVKTGCFLSVQLHNKFQDPYLKELVMDISMEEERCRNF